MSAVDQHSIGESTEAIPKLSEAIREPKGTKNHKQIKNIRSKNHLFFIKIM
jgi:hypothetical protein